MSLVYGLIVVMALLIALPATIFIAMMVKKGLSFSGGWIPYVILFVILFFIWQQFGVGIWALPILLIAGGLGLQLWSKTPPLTKTIGGLMLIGGCLLGVVIYIFGAENVESRRMALQAAASGNSAPLSDEEQASRLSRAKQDAEVAAAIKVAAKLAIDPLCTDAEGNELPACRVETIYPIENATVVTPAYGFCIQMNPGTKGDFAPIFNKKNKQTGDYQMFSTTGKSERVGVYNNPVGITIMGKRCGD